MNEQQPAPFIQRQPPPQGYLSWSDYWKAQGMPWRTEPEVESERRAYLAARRAVTPDIEHGIYPFRDESGSIKLTRADVEWLLATHEDGRFIGPVDWSDKKQRVRQGLDMRGCDLAEVDLSYLPLARLRGAFAADELQEMPRRERHLAVVHLEQANLFGAHLEFSELARVRLQGADLTQAWLSGANLFASHLEGVNFTNARMDGVNLRNAYLSDSVYLFGAVVGSAEYGGFLVADVRWGGVNLATANWDSVSMLGDELVVRQSSFLAGVKKRRYVTLSKVERAVRANRQLAIELRTQGLNERADYFAYRAQVLQRQVLRRQSRLGRTLGSWLLDLIAGYGYKPIRSVITYLLVILSFAAAYFALTNFAITTFLPSHSSPLAWYEAIVLSISSFHGRGLFPSGLSLGDPVAILAAFEAIIGLLIEITFIATFTQRFFAR